MVSVDYCTSILGMCNGSCHMVDYCTSILGVCNGSCQINQWGRLLHFHV